MFGWAVKYEPVAAFSDVLAFDAVNVFNDVSIFDWISVMSVKLGPQNWTATLTNQSSFWKLSWKIHSDLF